MVKTGIKDSAFTHQPRSVRTETNKIFCKIFRKNTTSETITDIDMDLILRRAHEHAAKEAQNKLN